MKPTHTALRIALGIGTLAALLGTNPHTATATTLTRNQSSANDIPDALVASGVTTYAVAAPKVFWQRRDCTVRPPALAANTNEAGAGAQLTDLEQINRVAVQGSPPRAVYAISADGYCGALANRAKSNIAADAENIFWITDQGLLRLSVNANAGDAPEVFAASITSAQSAEVAMDSDFVYALTVDGANNGAVYKIAKSDGTVTPLTSATGTFPNALQVSHAARAGYTGDYVYWLSNGALRRHNLNSGAIDTLAPNVSAYFAEGFRFSCSGFTCTSSDFVYYGSGSAVYRLNNATLASPTLLYDTGDANDRIYSLSTTGDALFFLEEHFVPCTPQPCFGGTFVDYLRRRARNTGGTTDLLATSPINSFNGRMYGAVSNTPDFVLWRDRGALLRLPNNAAALPQTNMRVTGLSITQGIQKPDNSVILIAGRRTFVRVFVKSDGPNVFGVTMHLVGSNGNELGTLSPVNDIGTNLTVWPSPFRSQLNDSFLFELPWSWLQTGLRLRAVLNPYRAPPQLSYANNELNSGPFTFAPSPALKTNFIAWQFAKGNTVYSPRFVKDIVQTYSWIMRAYPLASNLVFDGGAGNDPGFHPNLWFERDDTMTTRVERTHADCAVYDKTDANGTVDRSDRNLCASRYANIRMDQIRTENGLASSRFFYGFIPDSLGFPRGQACCAANVSSGPTGTPSGGTAWDTDGAYGDWYAAHEIAHTLGRNHPTPNGDDGATAAIEGCGHSRSDNNYPFSDALIGATNDTEGFDPGDATLGIRRAIYPGNVWADVMSYCNNQWISDYTYKGIYDYLMANPSLAANSARRAPARFESNAINGDFLRVFGTINTQTNAANFAALTRITTTDSVAVGTSGAYVIRLEDATGAALSNTRFDPEQADQAPNLLNIGETVAFAPGTRRIKLLRQSDNKVLAETPVSANVPVVSAVALQNAPNPVAGTVTLSWTASDADNDVLSFDVLYSSDGKPFQPVRGGLSGTSTQIDTTQLGGGAGVFRVVARDGVNSGRANSPAYTLAAKPPVPLILNPAEGLRIQYGQLINFNGAALDWQDGGVGDAGLSWSNQRGPLGTGAQLSIDTLPVGVNVITLRAVNSKGVEASASVTVTVSDDLELLGPTLIAAPGSLHWNFAAGATATQTETVHISNAGSGSPTWTASVVSAPWLSLSAASGAIPAGITVTADPAQIPDGDSAAGTLLITMPGTTEVPTQTFSIHVSASRGATSYIQSSTVSAPPLQVHLPLVRR
jgi:hypothetical protein